MITCPHCNYKHGWDIEAQDDAPAEKGEFFALPVKVERESKYYSDDRKTVYGCPDCLKLFLEP
jgi:hypothetical protein